MTSLRITIKEGLRIFRSSMRMKTDGVRIYEGNAKAVCEQIVDDCWNGRFFQASTTNFKQFWTRDFGWCTESLLKLGYNTEVERTLFYALDVFSKSRKVTTTITPDGEPYDFPSYAIDSLAWLLHSVALLNKKDLVLQFRDFLNNQIEKLYKNAVDKESGLPLPKRFSSIKDMAIRKRSCYDTCMLALVQRSAEKLGLVNPLASYDYISLLKKNYWNGQYFYDDITRKEYAAADANVFPFYLGIIKDEDMLRSAMEAIRMAKLDVPFAIKYTAKKAPVRFVWQELLLWGYEHDAVWTHIGPMYIKVLEQIDKVAAMHQKKNYAQVIETHKNYLEVFDANGAPFKTAFYHADQGMLWAANYLTL